MLASIATWLPTASQKMLYEGSHGSLGREKNELTNNLVNQTQ